MDVKGFVGAITRASLVSLPFMLLRCSHFLFFYPHGIPTFFSTQLRSMHISQLNSDPMTILRTIFDYRTEPEIDESILDEPDLDTPLEAVDTAPAVNYQVQDKGLTPETATSSDVMAPLLSPMSHLQVASDTTPHQIDVEVILEPRGEKEKPTQTPQTAGRQQMMEQIMHEKLQTNIVNNGETVVNHNLTNIPQIQQQTASQTQLNSATIQPITPTPANATTNSTVPQHNQPQQPQQQRPTVNHPTSQLSIRPLMSHLIPTPNAIRQRGRSANHRQNGRGSNGGYRGQGYRGRRGQGPQNNTNYSSANQRGKRGYAAPTGSVWRGSKHSLSPEQNNRDRRIIKLDLEDFLADNFGLRPSNPLTLEQFVAELKKEK